MDSLSVSSQPPKDQNFAQINTGPPFNLTIPPLDITLSQYYTIVGPLLLYLFWPAVCEHINIPSPFTENGKYIRYFSLRVEESLGV